MNFVRLTQKNVLTLQRYVGKVIIMSSELKRATVYFEPDLHRAVRLKAVNTNQSISEVVNESVRSMLSEDEEDLAAFEETASDRLMTYEELLARLKTDGKI